MSCEPLWKNQSFVFEHVIGEKLFSLLKLSQTNSLVPATAELLLSRISIENIQNFTLTKKPNHGSRSALWARNVYEILRDFIFKWL